MLKAIAYSFILFVAWILISANMGWGTFLSDWVKYLPFKDKAAHFILIGLLSFFVNVLLEMRNIKIFSRNFFLGSVCVLVLVTIEEGSQYFLSNRNCDWLDLLANYLGIYFFGKISLFLKNRM